MFPTSRLFLPQWIRDTSNREKQIWAWKAPGLETVFWCFFGIEMGRMFPIQKKTMWFSMGIN